MGNCANNLLPCLSLDAAKRKVRQSSGPGAAVLPVLESPPVTEPAEVAAAPVAPRPYTDSASLPQRTITSIQPTDQNTSVKASVLDYSRWDHIGDSESDSDDPTQKTAAIVSGFTGRDHVKINGNYALAPVWNHGCKVFVHMASYDGNLANPKQEAICLYFWDLRDGVHYNGWWIGPGVGSDSVLAFNPGAAPEPPFGGWHEPWFHDASPTARVEVLGSSVPRVLSPEPRVPRVAVEAVLEPVVQNFGRFSSAWCCVQCFDIVKSPVILCCGHPVCLHHVKSQERFCCPWTPYCNSKQFPADVGSQGWQPAGVLEHLLSFTPSQADHHSSPAVGVVGVNESADAYEKAVQEARTPLQLVVAYENLADARGNAGDAALAAAASEASLFVQRSFGGAKLAELERKPYAFEAMMSTLEVQVLQVYKFLRLKIAVWSKICGSVDTIRQALSRLPTPHLWEPKVHFKDLVAELQAASKDDLSLQAAVECPVCYNMLFEPVTTPCGHTFCHACLARTLDFGGQCPLCRGQLAGHIQNYSICEPLQYLLAETWPEAYSVKMKEVAEEQREHRKESWLPILSPLLVFPSYGCNVHISRPEHRLIIRQTLALGLRRFGACMINADTGELAEYGTELVMTNFHLLSDGASLMESTGCRRFRVLKAVSHEGHTRAEVEYLLDVDEPASEYSVTLPITLASLRGACSLLPAALGQPLQMRVEQVLRTETLSRWMEEGRCDEFVWGMISFLPFPAQEKYRFLAMSSKHERLLALTETLRQVARNLSEAIATAPDDDSVAASQASMPVQTSDSPPSE